MKNRNMLVIGITTLAVATLLYLAYNKKQQAKIDNETEPDYIQLLDKIAKAPK